METLLDSRMNIERRVLADLCYQDPHPSQDWLRDTDFVTRQHATVYRALLDMREHGIAAPGLSALQAWLTQHGQVMDFNALLDITEGLSVRENVRPAIAMLKRLAVGSSLSGLGSTLVAGGDPDELLAITATTAENARGILERDDTESQDQIIDDLLSELEMGPDPRKLGTGFADLDSYGLITRGSVTVLAARTSIGKTALAVTLAMNVARLGHGVVYIAAEESPREILYRCGLCFASMGNRAPLANALTLLKSLPIRVRAARRLPQIDLAVTEGQSTTGAELLIIDHLQEIHAEQPNERIRELGEILRGIRALARDRNVAVLLLAQVSRRPDSRVDKRPELSDLRDSGEIENMADRVWMLHRDDRLTDDAELFVAKNRTGPKGTVQLTMLQPDSRFVAAGRA